MAAAASNSCVPLSYMSTSVSTVTWSEDQRIAVTTNEAIFVLTLKGVTYNLHASGMKGKPPFVMSMATCLNSQPHPPGIGVPLNIPAFDQRPERVSMIPVLDHIVNGGCGGEMFEASGWSPAVCNHLGGCLLTALTSSGRLLLLSPPGSSLTKWEQTIDLSDTLCSLLKGCGFNPDSLSEQADSPEGEAENLSFPEFVRRRLLVACTTFAWLPSILQQHSEAVAVGVGGAAVVALGTRSGHVFLWQLQVPLVKGRAPDVAVVCVSELPVGPPGLGEVWATSLRWSYSNPATAALVVGCTNGQVFSLHWDDLRGQRSQDGKAWLDQPVVRQLWPFADGVGVHHLSLEAQEGGGDLPWIVLSKGCSLIALPGSALQRANVCPHTSPPSETSPDSIPPNTLPPHVVISGVHTMPVSALSSLPFNEYISSSLDGSLQRFTLPNGSGSHDWSCDFHVAPEPVSMDTVPPGQVYSVQGASTSHSGIFAAIAINPRVDFSYHRKRFRSQLHFLTLTSSKSIETRLQEGATSEWDLCEYMREAVDTENELVGVVALSSGMDEGLSVKQLKLQLQIHMITQKDHARGKKCIVAILHQHTVAALMAWGAWREGRTIEVDEQSNISLQLMCQWLLSSELTVPPELDLVNWVLSQLPGRTAIAELCPICGVEVVLSNLLQEVCCNGHSWKRCTITLRLGTHSLCSKCILCESTAHNTQSLRVLDGSWLHYLLLSTPCCVLCDGYFEQLV